MKKENKLQIRNSTAEFLIFTRQAGEDGIEVRVAEETVWLTQPLIAELFQTTVPNISMHLRNIYETEELTAEATLKNFLTVRQEGARQVRRSLEYYTGKTFIAFQIAWIPFHSRWTLSRDAQRRPRILFLADRNILADQAYNAFSAFPDDALVRISPADIRKKGKVPKNGSIFLTIFQTFMSGPPKNGQPSPYFGDYPPDFFDFIVIDECHRGGANDESNWRGILEYYASAVQLGLTATPRRKDNVDTYAYFGDPVYIYSLKDGINDGFLTPFKVKQIQTTLDYYVYTSDDTVL
jgi:type I restriction enzyme R subunit